MSTLELRESAGRTWAYLDLVTVNGRGRLNPRLQFIFQARPVEYSKVVLKDVSLRLEHREELIGEGRVVGGEVHYALAQVVFEVATSQRLLRWVTDDLQQTATSLDLVATLRGVGSFCVDPNAPDGRWVLVNDPAPGEWQDFNAAPSYPGTIQIPRADWFTKVLGPTRNEDYRYVEVALPRNDSGLRQEWARAVDHLENAERAYASGDNPAVFGHLRAAIDAIPGAKKAILDEVKDEFKRRRLDDLLKTAGEFLHAGRHVSTDGETVGTFPVDRLDAGFALDLVRVLISHFSAMLSAARAQQ